MKDGYVLFYMLPKTRTVYLPTLVQLEKKGLVLEQALRKPWELRRAYLRA